MKRFITRAFFGSRQLPWVRRLGRASLNVPFMAPLIRSSLRYVLSLSDQRVWASCPYGEIYIEPYSENTSILGVPEDDVCSTMTSLLRQGMCFYDLGAHIGFYSLMASRIVGTSGQVFTFEPDPENFRICQETVARNAAANIRSYPFAAWERDESVTFHRGSGSRTSGGLDVPCRTGIGWTEQITVEAISLDTFVRTHRPPDVVKVDVEGAEANVLRGARHVLDCGATWIIEIHNPSALAECIQILTQAKYNTRQLGPEPEPPFHLLAHPGAESV